MIKKGTILDTGNPTQFRIKKADQLRTSLSQLFSLFDTYSGALESLSSLENKIAEELRNLYSHETVYTVTIQRLTTFLNFKADFTAKNIFNFKKELQKTKGLNSTFNSMTPFVKSYLKNYALIDHYIKKVAKISLECDAQKSKKGYFANSKAKQLIRNQKKLEDAKTKTFVTSNNIVELSNKVNLERFDRLNPTISEFISYQLGVGSIPEVYTSSLGNYKEIMSQKIDGKFNDLFFINTSSFNNNLLHNGTNGLEIQRNSKTDQSYTYKQNVQNNYYILADDPQGRDIINSTRNGTFNNQSYQKDQTSYALESMEIKPKNSYGMLSIQERPKIHSNLPMIEYNERLTSKNQLFGS
jgi:hypothetical protein